MRTHARTRIQPGLYRLGEWEIKRSSITGPPSGGRYKGSGLRETVWLVYPAGRSRDIPLSKLPGYARCDTLVEATAYAIQATERAGATVETAVCQACSWEGPSATTKDDVCPSCGQGTLMHFTPASGDRS
jgi:hypothetical protein